MIGKPAFAILLLTAAAGPALSDDVFRAQLNAPLLIGTEKGEEQDAGGPLQVVSKTTIPNPAQVTIQYTTELQGSGGTAPYVYSIIGNDYGFHIVDGTLSGSFEAKGPLSLIVKAVDRSTPPKESTLTLSTTVEDAAPMAAPDFGPSAFPAGASVSRDAPQVSGADGSIAFSVVSGSLPPGIALSASGRMTGTITGAAGATGTAAIRIADAHSHIEATFPWSISSPPASSHLPFQGSFYSVWENRWYVNGMGAPAELRDGLNGWAAVSLSVGEKMGLHYDRTVAADSFIIASRAPFQFRVIAGSSLASMVDVSPILSYTSGLQEFTLAAPFNAPYIGLRVISATGNAYIAEFNVGTGGAFSQ